MTWLYITILIMVVIIFAIYIIYQAKKNGLRETALAAILKAEEQYYSTTGKERFEIAFNYVYELIPVAWKVILPKELLKKFLDNLIQSTFDEVKDLLNFEKTSLKASLKGGKK